MIIVNLILAIIILVFEIIFSWGILDAPRPSDTRSDIDLAAMLQSDPFGKSVDRSAQLVDEILKNPICIEGRLGFAGEAVSQTTILIDGTHTPVELVGTIGSGQDSTAAFSLGNDKIMWLSQDEQLGDWQIDEIKQKGVRLSKLDETLVLQQRKGSDSETSPETRDPQAISVDETLIN